MKFPSQIFFLLFLSPFTSISQSLKDISILADQHQKCLDEGVDMQGCSRNYCLQMDSCLNLVYNNIRKLLTDTEKENLKKEQLNWLKKRDLYYKKEQSEFKKQFDSGEWGSDMFMIVYQNDAEFVRKRVVVLIQKLNSIQTHKN